VKVRLSDFTRVGALKPAPPVLLLAETGPVSNLAAAVDSVFLVRDPFPVGNVNDLLNPGA
jgi:hypothetical protein